MTFGGGVVGAADLSAQRLYGLVLAGRKELPTLLRARSWDPGGKDRGRLLHGANVVIAGADAAVGAALEALLAPTGAHVQRITAGARPAPTPAPTEGVDVLVLLPGAASLGAAELAQLPEGAVLVDASAPDADATRAVEVDVLAAGLAAGRPLHAAVLADPVSAADLPGDHALWASPRALVVPVGSGA